MFWSKKKPETVELEFAIDVLQSLIATASCGPPEVHATVQEYNEKIFKCIERLHNASK